MKKIGVKIATLFLSVFLVFQILEVSIDGTKDEEVVSLCKVTEDNSENLVKDKVINNIKEIEETREVNNKSYIEEEVVNKATEEIEEEVYVSEETSFKHIEGSYSEEKVNNAEEALDSIEEVKDLINIENPEEELEVLKTEETDILKSYKLQQVYNNIPVYGRELIVATDKNGNTTSLGGNYIEKLNINTTPSISEGDVLNILKEKYGQAAIVEIIGLKIYSLNNIEPVLCYNGRVKIETEEVYRNLNVFVNASNGEIVSETSFLVTENVETTATDLNNKERTINVYNVTNKDKYSFLRKKYEMYDSIRNIKVYNALDLKLFSLLPGIIVGSKDNLWNDRVAVTTMANLSETYDYYLNKFGRNSFDNNGAEIKASIHYKAPFTSTGFDNAYWDGEKFVFGDGANYFKPLSGGLDVVAHEFTHGVVQYTADLIYSGESGAINESYADILGNLVEGKDDPQWLLGEDVMLNPENIALRSMSYPELCGQPSKVNGEFYVDTSDTSYENDYGGVHTNSGIINHAAYLMWENGIRDKDELGKLFYNSLYLMTSSSTFEDCKVAVLSSAKKMGMGKEKIKIINSAFTEVGIN